MSRIRLDRAVGILIFSGASRTNCVVLLCTTQSSGEHTAETQVLVSFSKGEATSESLRNDVGERISQQSNSLVRAGLGSFPTEREAPRKLSVLTGAQETITGELAQLKP